MDSITVFSWLRCSFVCAGQVVSARQGYDLTGTVTVTGTGTGTARHVTSRHGHELTARQGQGYLDLMTLLFSSWMLVILMLYKLELERALNFPVL